MFADLPKELILRLAAEVTEALPVLVVDDSKKYLLSANDETTVKDLQDAIMKVTECQEVPNLLHYSLLTDQTDKAVQYIDSFGFKFHHEDLFEDHPVHDYADCITLEMVTDPSELSTLNLKDNKSGDRYPLTMKHSRMEIDYIQEAIERNPTLSDIADHLGYMIYGLAFNMDEIFDEC